MVKYNSFKNNYILKFLIFYIYIYALLFFFFIYFIIRGSTPFNQYTFQHEMQSDFHQSRGTWKLLLPPPRNIPPGLTCNIRGSHKFPVQL